MHGILTHSESVKKGYKRGNIKWSVPLRSLHLMPVVDSSLFEIGGSRWKLLISCGSRNRDFPEQVTVQLFSCNSEVVLSHIEMSISQETKDDKRLAKEGQKAAYPFCSVIEFAVPLKDLRDPAQNGQIADELLVSVDFKDLKAVEDVEVPPRFKELMRNVAVEIIDEESIRQLLIHEKPVSGVVSSKRNESYSVYASSSVNLWANRASDRRYWLSKRCEDGSLVVKTCLNKAKLLERFEDICDHGNLGISSVTLFMEKASSTSSQEENDDSILIFAKLHDPEYQDPSYLGHWIVQKSAECRAFHERIVMEQDLFKDDEEYTACLEMGRYRPEDITKKQGSLEECGVGSGSVVILQRKTKREQNPSSSCVHVTTRGIPSEEIEKACGLTSYAQRDDQHEDSQGNGMPSQPFTSHPLVDNLEENWTLPTRDLPEQAHSKPRKKLFRRLFKPKIFMVMAKGLGIGAIFVGVNLIVQSQLHPRWHENFEDIPKMLGWYGGESTNILKQKDITWHYALDD